MTVTKQVVLTLHCDAAGCTQQLRFDEAEGLPSGRPFDLFQCHFLARLQGWHKVHGHPLDYCPAHAEP